MTKDDSLSEDEITYTSDAADASAAVDAVQSGINVNGDAAASISAKEANPATPMDESKSTGFSLILLPILLFKFTIVLLVKFATDIVVYPTLFLYRIARLGKRKVLTSLFGKKDGRLNVKVNGDSSSGAES